MAKYTLQQFKEQFPNDDACLDYLFEKKFGKLTACPECSVESKFTRVKGRRSYQCPICSYQIYPTANTVFHQSTTSLHIWFTSIFMFTTTRNGVAAKELERTFNICYKTALRMAHQIKKLMMDTESQKLFGEIQIDETYFGMLGKNMHNVVKEVKQIRTGSGSKTGVIGMIEKDGRIITKVLDLETDVKDTFHTILKNHIDKDSVVITDAHAAYQKINESFKKHVRIDHKKDEYTLDGFTTNNIENYWSTLKRMIKGTHIHVSKKHLPKYLAENSFRYVNRHEPEQMFEKILSNV